MITLYHYSKLNLDQVELNPGGFGKHSFTKSDQKVSLYPRIFFYTDPEEKERFFNGNFLYSTKVSEQKIYDLQDDKDQIIESIKHENNNVLNFDTLFETIHENYSGLKYTICDREIVCWLDPIMVNKIL